MHLITETFSTTNVEAVEALSVSIVEILLDYIVFQ